MRKKNLILAALFILAASIGLVIGADHIDAPAVSSTTSDITDYYAFQSPETTDNLVFVANLQGLLDPTATANASFDENVMIEFNIDNDGDAVEDLVIQVVFEDGMAKAYGPVSPSQTGLTSKLETEASLIETSITAFGDSPSIGRKDDISLFAGPRDDPFFMDFAQYGEIIAGNATGFNDPGSDTFAGTNVMSVVIEVPKSRLGTAATLNTWVESKRKS